MVRAKLTRRAVLQGSAAAATAFSWPRLVAHAVTLETEALLGELHQRHGGELMRVEISHAGPLGRYRSWDAARPVVQWSTVR